MIDTTSLETRPETEAIPPVRTVTSRIFGSLLGLFVCLLMLWPVLHYQLVRHYGLSPWKCFGVAMYCTRSQSTFEVLQVTPQGFQLLAYDDFQTAGLAYQLRRYARDRQTLGLLAGPPPLKAAAAIFREHPDWRDLLFRCRLYRINPETARMEADQKCVYHFRHQQGRVFLFDQDEKTQLLGTESAL